MTRLLLVTTGDTIAYRHHAGRPSVASGAELLDTVAPGTTTARVSTEDMLAEPSWDISPATMLALARRVRTALLDDGFDGIVVAHGVDTLAETAFLADLLAGPAAARGAIVFTGAIRCLDAPGSDGSRNLTASLGAAADPALRGLGAVVCAAGELHAARRATLADTTRTAAFSSAPHQPLGRVLDGRAELTDTPPPRPPHVDGMAESDVALIKTYPGIPPALLMTAADAGARGIVLEGTGAGNVPVELFGTIGELTEWDIPVVLASRAHAAAPDTRCGAGLATRLGAIPAPGLTGAHARSALMVALAAGGVDVVRDWFARL